MAEAKAMTMSDVGEELDQDIADVIVAGLMPPAAVKLLHELQSKRDQMRDQTGRILNIAAKLNDVGIVTPGTFGLAEYENDPDCVAKFVGTPPIDIAQPIEVAVSWPLISNVWLAQVMSDSLYKHVRITIALVGAP